MKWRHTHLRSPYVVDPHFCGFTVEGVDSGGHVILVEVEKREGDAITQQVHDALVETHGRFGDLDLVTSAVGFGDEEEVGEEETVDVRLRNRFANFELESALQQQVAPLLRSAPRNRTCQVELTELTRQLQKTAQSRDV